MHADIQWTADGWRLTDQQSTTGTRVDSIRLESGDGILLYDGMVIEIGPWSFVVAGSGREPSESAAELRIEDRTHTTLIRSLSDDSTSTRDLAWRSFVGLYGSVVKQYASRFSIDTNDVDDIM